MFYERSESLVGVCRDVGTSSSRTLTLDLTKFDKKEERKEKRKRGSKRSRSWAGEAESKETPKKRVTRSSAGGKDGKTSS